MTSLLTAASAEQTQASGFNPMNLILLVALAFMIFMMFRGRQKAKKAQEELRSKLHVGAQVMTNFGLFGTVLRQNPDENQVVLELSPGTTATVHSGAIAKVVEPAAAAETEQAPAEPAVESPEETERRLNDEEK
ncbi:preprotein translocase subunit YajC [Zhihengliuella sp.]|uniref:preprotein translocase subunit YajC n=1 Tax=Zhihengliuella sp. TaxID=1954483 RepID=UPI002811F1EC|nr:preprotein translocase subunit YajC [Zhihengliuella sp.]